MSGAVTLRQGVVADVDAIRDLTRAAYAKWIAVIGREPRPMTADYDAAIHAHRFDLLFVGDTMAGLIETVAQDGGLLIENVAVTPKFQGEGLGRRLMQHAEDLARSLAIGEMRLYTNQRFAENISLYSALGYAFDREEALPAGVVIHMRKPLP